MFSFGVGKLVLVPPGSNPTPVQVGILQDVSIDVSFESKKLKGSRQFPDFVTRSGANATGKAKHAAISSGFIASILTGATTTTGNVVGVDDEAGTIPGTPYQVTVANSATFDTDLGVLDVTTGLFMTRVASAPSTGQYSVSAGVYTFAAADTTHVLKISYTYTVAGSGKKVVYTNQLMGQVTVFQMHLFSSFNSKSSYFKLHAVVFPKFSLAFKQEDYLESDLDFEFFAASDGTVATVALSE